MSPRLKARVAGAWVDTDQVGAVRVAGAWVPFAPPGDAPAYEGIEWGLPPAETNLVDPGESYHMGCTFTLTAAKPSFGVRWRVPDTLDAPPLGFYATLYTVSPTAQIRKQLIVPVAGGDQDFLWTVPTDPLPTTETYVVGITTVRYSFRAAGTSGGFPFPSPSGNVQAGIGRLAGGGDPDAVPASNFESIYYIAPLIGV